MEYRPFGQTGIQVSAIGLGCWEIGGGYGKIEEEEFIRAVPRALDLGINCFDTAEAYGFGASERSLAKALGTRRKEAIVVTKFGVGYKEAPNFRDSSRQRVIASIEKSLQNLNTDYVDVYMVHWPARPASLAFPTSVASKSKRARVPDVWMWRSTAGTCLTGACRKRSSRTVASTIWVSWLMARWRTVC